jgi:serine/threonine-protein kinase
MSSTQDQDKINRLQQALGDTYVIGNRIGGGGMGDVYVATHKTLGDKRAIKLLADDLAKDPVLVERFINEAKIEANLQHPNIVKVFDIGQKDQFYYLVMSFVEGEDLDKVIRERKKTRMPMDVRESVNIALQVVKALECAHDNGIVHRDLKPSNIRIDRYGTIIVMDFGIARVRQAGLQGKTVLGERLGTPLYMSPEQAAGRPVDTRSDLYSLGVILYEMLSGANPFEAENPIAICMKHIQYEPPDLIDVRPEVPPEISDIVKRLLAKDPDNRYQDAAGLRQALSGGGVISDVPTARPAAVVPSHLLQLGPLDAILHQIPDTQLDRPLTESETRLLTLIDGTKSIREVLNVSGIPETETAEALKTLQNDGVVYSEIPLGSDQPGVFEPTFPGKKTTSRGAPMFSSAATSTAKTETLKPRTATATVPAPPVTPAKKFSIALAGAAAAVVVVLVVAAYFIFRGGPAVLSAVQVDASPFATVTITSEKGDKILTDDTPFTVSLAPGVYNFDFQAPDQAPKRVTQKITAQSSSPVRVDFWSPGETKKLLESYIQ